MTRLRIFLLNTLEFLSVCVRIIWLSVTAPTKATVIRARRYRVDK